MAAKPVRETRTAQILHDGQRMMAVYDSNKQKDRDGDSGECSPKPALQQRLTTMTTTDTTVVCMTMTVKPQYTVIQTSPKI